MQTRKPSGTVDLIVKLNRNIEQDSAKIYIEETVFLRTEVILSISRFPQFPPQLSYIIPSGAEVTDSLRVLAQSF